MHYQKSKFANQVLLNGSLMCAVDCETTGLIPGKSEILQVAIIPIGPDFEPLAEAGFFEMRLKPLRVHDPDDPDTKVNRFTYGSAIKNGIDPFLAADLLTEWFEKLGLGPGKQLVPLGHNFCQFDRLFLIDWLGPKNYSYIFSYLARDTLIASIFMNDLADWRAENVLFPKYTLGSMAARLGIERGVRHDAISDALCAARCYKRLLGMPLLSPVAVSQMSEVQHSAYQAGWSQAKSGATLLCENESQREYWAQGFNDATLDSQRTVDPTDGISDSEIKMGELKAGD